MYDATVPFHYRNDVSPNRPPDDYNHTNVTFSCSHSKFTIRDAENRFTGRTYILEDYFRKRVFGKESERLPKALTINVPGHGFMDFTTYHVPESQKMTKKEKTAARKQLATKRMLEGGNPSARRFRKRSKDNVAVYLPGHDNPQLIVIRK